MLSGVWSQETFAELAIGTQIHHFIACEATNARVGRRYALETRRAHIKRHAGAFVELGLLRLGYQGSKHFAMLAALI